MGEVSKQTNYLSNEEAMVLDVVTVATNRVVPKVSTVKSEVKETGNGVADERDEQRSVPYLVNRETVDELLLFIFREVTQNHAAKKART